MIGKLLRLSLLFSLSWLVAAFSSRIAYFGRPLPRISRVVPGVFMTGSIRERQLLSNSRILHLSSSSSSSTNDSSDASMKAGGLVAQSDVVKSQLFNAFTNLGVADQYDAVLTGLCAKILDDRKITEAQAVVSVVDCTDLLQEMNEQKITASPRSLMALIDSTVKTQDAMCMARVVSLCLKNVGGLRQYGSQQRDIIMFPLNDNVRILCPDGKKKTASERLASVEDVPKDDRANEIANAGLFGATAVVSEVVNLSTSSDTIEHIAASTILSLMVTVTLVDNFYDVLKTGSQFAVLQLGKDNKAISELKLPEKDALPLGLGTGTLTGSVVRGLTRLLTVDTVRESQCEAAALYTAYMLGLPCFAYRPNALEASVLVAESASPDSALDNLLTSAGILRMLVWLLAPTAMEHMTHPQLIMSDPREAEGFLQRLEDYFSSTDDRLFWIGETRKPELIKWAYTEADGLLRSNKQVVGELSNRLASGAATIGDCIAVIEGW